MIIKSGQAPAVLFQSGIIDFSVINISKYNRAVPAFKCFVCTNMLDPAVFIPDDQMSEKCRLSSVIVDPFQEAHFSFVPPGAHHGAQSIASLTRMTRSSMLDVIRQDYVRTAKAKGLSAAAIIFFHEVKNALIPIITTIGMDFGSLLGGAVLCETIFSIQGIGRLMVDSIKRRDYPVVQGCVIFIALACCLVNLAVDLLYMVIEPKLKKKKTEE